MMSRMCVRCKETKELPSFNKYKNRPDGVGTICKDCTNKRNRENKAAKALAEGRTIRVYPARPEGKKRCPRCELWKDETDFGKTKGRYDGLSNYCKPCLKVRRDLSFNKPGAKEKRRSYSLKTAYGITSEKWEALYLFQRQVCALCGGEAGGKHNVLHTDHDHSSGQVRGLLCFDCNKLLGVYELLVREGRIESFDTYRKDPPFLTMQHQLDFEEVFA